MDLQLKGMQHILPRIEAMAKAQQLSLQHPFFQTDLIELGIGLPNHLKLSGVKDKVLLKMLAKSYLPDAVIERRKQGMGVPTSQWFRRGLMPLAAYWLNKKRLEKSGLLNQAVTILAESAKKGVQSTTNVIDALNHSEIAYDKENRPVYFAESAWMLQNAQESYPDITFHFTSEFSA